MNQRAAAASWRGQDALWLDHVSLRTDDVEWMASARWLTLWAVTTPAGLLSSLPHLEFLELRGGSGSSLDTVDGCQRLRFLGVNQVRGLVDLSVIPTLGSLELLSLYGQPKVTHLPSFASLETLRRVELGSLKGLSGLTGLHDAPALEELQLTNQVGVVADDAERLAAHPTLTHFKWVAESGPSERVRAPFEATVSRPAPRILHPQEWFGRPLPASRQVREVADDARTDKCSLSQ